MKTKLLKKIRKQYSIVYYPEGFIYDGRLYHKGKYVVDYVWSFRPAWYLDSFNSKQEALNHIMYIVGRDYSKYSRKYKKPNYKGIKVWNV